jgi:hypothetical protein
MKTLLSILVVIVITANSCGAKMPAPGVAITIYNDNFAVVKERRQMDFDKGVNTVKFTDVASAIDPTSVNFKCLSSPDGVSILEQNYEYDLVNTASLLKRYIDKDVQIVLKGSGSSSDSLKLGVLNAAVGNDLIISNGDGGLDIISRNSVESISLAKAPEDLVTKPTLVWLAQSEEKDDQLCQVTYTTNNVGWKADYSAVLNDAEDAIDLTAWVTVDNKSGAGYKDATIKLIAGDVRRIQPARMPRSNMYKGMERAMAAEGGGFQEKEFMDYHMYTLGRKSTINNNQVKQIELMDPAEGIKTTKLYVFEVSQWGHLKKSEKVQVKFEFKNTEENQLGMALPKGKVRVFKKDPADDTLEFVGEDLIDHTAKKETLSLYIGDAFDIVAEDKISDAKHASSYDRLTHTIEVRNRKDTPISIFVDELCPKGRNWKISSNSHKYEKKDGYTARFKVDVEADSTSTLVYTVIQTW